VLPYISSISNLLGELYYELDKIFGIFIRLLLILNTLFCLNGPYLGLGVSAFFFFIILSLGLRRLICQFLSFNKRPYPILISLFLNGSMGNISFFHNNLFCKGIVCNIVGGINFRKS